MLKLIQLKSKIKDDLKEINKLIELSIKNKNQKLNEIYQFLSQERGKQVRSSIIILIGNLTNIKDKSNLYRLAAGIELIHLASLIHDDIIDEADIRRNQETIHKKFGLNNGIIMGVHCYSIALKLFASIKNVSVIDHISATVTDLCEGEFIQVNERHNYELSENEYWKIVEKKTSALFKASCKLSAELCNMEANHIDELTNYGLILGDIFQLVDDYLDIYDTDNKLSKNVEQDFVSGDISLPIIIAKKISKSNSKEDILNTFKSNNKNIAEEIKQKILDKKTHAISSINKCSDIYNTNDLNCLLDIITDRVN